MGSLTSSISDKIESGEIKTDSFGRIIKEDGKSEENQGMYNAASSKAIEQSAIDRRFNERFPELGVEFKKIQAEQYALYQKKMLAYGKSNITLGSSMETEKEREFSLLGVSIRLHDKLSRLKNLLINKNDNFVEDESIEDTIIDIANYGVIALMVKRNLWW